MKNTISYERCFFADNRRIPRADDSARARIRIPHDDRRSAGSNRIVLQTLLHIRSVAVRSENDRGNRPRQKTVQTFAPYRAQDFQKRIDFLGKVCYNISYWKQRES